MSRDTACFKAQLLDLLKYVKPLMSWKGSSLEAPFRWHTEEFGICRALKSSKEMT